MKDLITGTHQQIEFNGREPVTVEHVAFAGGWSDTSTLLSCYQQADDETLLEVMSFAKKITERSQNG